MADAKQVQIRRDTAANLATATPVEAELGFDQTNKRLVIGDGTTAGGIPHVNYIDSRTGLFMRGTVGGTGNAITLTLSPAATSYQNYMRIAFIATASNTGTVTINVNGLGTRTVQKLSSGSLVDLESGDLVSGVYYEAVYNGSIFQITTIYGSGLISVGQGDLRTSVGSVSISSSSGLRTLPGGLYGFYPQISRTGSSGTATAQIYSSAAASSYASYIYLVSGSGNSLTARQNYITSSPPYDLGDGEAGGFFYALVNSAGYIVSTYIADAPPWAYNGPTDIRACLKCPVTGKKYRRIMKKRSLERIMDGAPIEYKNEEITHKIKNKDMGLIPHPFGDIPDGHHVVLFDPMDDKIRKLIDFQNAGGHEEVADYLANNKFEVGNSCKRCGPKGVHVHSLKYRYEKKF